MRKQFNQQSLRNRVLKQKQANLQMMRCNQKNNYISTARHAGRFKEDTYGWHTLNEGRIQKAFQRSARFKHLSGGLMDVALCPSERAHSNKS